MEIDVHAVNIHCGIEEDHLTSLYLYHSNDFNLKSNGLKKK